MREDSYVPLPREVHPSLSFLHGFDLSAWDRDTIQVMRPPSMMDLRAEQAMEPPLSSDHPVITLDRRRVSAPAPFVGRYPDDQARYVWSVWVDSAGRYIAGDARLVWTHRVGE